MMKNKILVVIIMVSAFWFSCEKEMNITDFKDDFGDYEPELKIEGILRQDNPQKSIVRIISSSAITDTEIFDGKDNDNDGQIDEHDEVLPLIQDTTAEVKVINLDTGDEYEFEYVEKADQFEYWSDEDDYEFSEEISYGAFKPKSDSFELIEFNRYKLEVYSQKFGKTITGETTVYPAVEFMDTTIYDMQDSIVFMKTSDRKELFWQSVKEVTAYYVTYEEVISLVNGEYETDYWYATTASVNHDVNDNYPNVSVGSELIWDNDFEIIFKMTVEAVSPELGTYMFTDLPLNDPSRTNLRDENGEPVMGTFGAASANYIYVAIGEN